MPAVVSFDLDFSPIPGPGGPFSVAPVPWDRDAFGFPFYQVRLESGSLSGLVAALETWLAERPVDEPCLVHTVLASGDFSAASALCGCGFYPVENSYFMKVEIARQGDEVEIADSAQIRVAEARDLARLQELAAGAFRYVRLHLDPNLPREGADRRQRRWIENSMAAGETIFLFEHGNPPKVLGFLSCQARADGEAYLSLTGFDPAYQASGLVIPMFRAAFDQLIDLGFQTASLRCSANNRSSFQLAASLGFHALEMQTTFHWFRAASERPKAPRRTS